MSSTTLGLLKSLHVILRPATADLTQRRRAMRHLRARTSEAQSSRVHMGKASTDDLRWLYPGATRAAAARHWITLGSTLVVVTDVAAAPPRSGRIIRRWCGPAG
jgi:hypothetical protein